MMMLNKQQNLKLDHISVCICTYKRPELLSRALFGVTSQSTKSSFSYEIIVVDNDCHRSAEEIVRLFQPGKAVKIIYDCEPVQNIALTRNKAILNATGNFIAFIDDDEIPADDWLYRLYQCIKDYNADAVLGPVLPDFPNGAPSWLKKSGLCDRPRNVTGSPITRRDMRTGNILFQRYIFAKDDMWFNPSRGLTGGEDAEFISRQLKKGRKIVWCNEAVVHEMVSEERWLASFYLKRNFRIGTSNGQSIRRFRRYGEALKTFLIFNFYAALLPFSMLAGKHVWIKILTRVYFNAGCILSFLKLKNVKQIE